MIGTEIKVNGKAVAEYDLIPDSEWFAIRSIPKTTNKIKVVKVYASKY